MVESKFEEVKSVIDKMILYHSVLVSDIDNEPEFGDYTYGFYPYEILFLMHIRRKLGLPVPDKFEDLGEGVGSLQYETDRMQFIGRGRNVSERWRWNLTGRLPIPLVQCWIRL